MRHMPLLRSRYNYQRYERQTYTNSLRKDLREKLKKYSISISQPETKILDKMIEYFLADKNNKEILTNLVENYY